MWLIQAKKRAKNQQLRTSLPRDAVSYPLQEPHMSDIYAGLNLGFRPPARLFPIAAERFIANRVKGTMRRGQVEAALENQTFDALPDTYTQSALTQHERRSLSSIHPSLMGGEYLPDFEDDEIEVARLELESVTGDVISVRLRRDLGGFHYRVVDEYDGECLSETRNIRVDKPLTLHDFGKFVCRASCLADIISTNDFTDFEDANAFTHAKSSYYPEFREFVERTIESLVPERDDIDEEPRQCP
jgi:hypothetical protein